KYLALHKSAPLGTLIQVKNETNGATVWVKVIGRLPELDQNQNVIIKLSPRAMDRISPVDKRFRAKINYSL
ncbi:MAG: peptidoglycan-binding protein, partial [Bacteroidota bacterium]